MTDNALINLGELSKPATVLIEKIADAMGGIFKPYQIVRVAKAEAEAEQIRAESEIQIGDLHRRAMHRFLEEEAKKQENIEEIIRRALPLLTKDASPDQVEEDWITNFFDKCRIISDEDMQTLWSRILAGQANTPRSYSRRTINLLADLDKSDAELFARLCGFAWQIGNLVPLIYDVQSAIYTSERINFDTLSHLESLGLIRFDPLAGFRRMRLPKSLGVYYYGRRAQLSLPKDEDNELDLGKVLLTRAGQELAPVCGSRPVEGLFEFVYDSWAKNSHVESRAAEQADPADGS